LARRGKRLPKKEPKVKVEPTTAPTDPADETKPASGESTQQQSEEQQPASEEPQKQEEETQPEQAQNEETPEGSSEGTEDSTSQKLEKEL
jgi:hypothetical protein